MRRRNTSLWFGSGVVGLFFFVAALAPFLARYDPRDLSGPPLTPPSTAHLLGTNDLGQDIWAQVVWGARWSLVIAVATASIAVALGVVLGALAPLLGRMADESLMRMIDVLLALPGLPLLILVTALAGPNRLVLVVSLAAFIWPRIARIVRSEVLTLRDTGFMTAAMAFGARRAYVLRRHVLPAVAPLVGASVVEVAGIAIFLDAGLGFLGIGDPTAPSWGLMLERANAYPGLYFTRAWTWWVIPPAVAITTVVLGLALAWLGLEAKINPALRREELDGV